MAQKKRLRVDIDESRCFSNPHLQDPSCRIDESSLGPAPTLKVDVEAGLRARLLQGLEAAVSEVESECAAHTPHRDQSVYTGVSGVALLHFHLATTLYSGSNKDDPGEQQKQRSLHLNKCLTLLEHSCFPQLDTRRLTFLCGCAGPLAIGAVAYSLQGKTRQSNECVERLKNLFLLDKGGFSSASASELLYGQVGYLYALLFVNCYLPGAVDEGIVSEVVTLILDRGKEGASSIGSGCGLMYTWHGKHYLGAAHGLTGILTVLLQVSSPSLKPGITALVKQCVDYLLGLRFPSGNLSSSLESSASDRLVHWCHGAPGFAHLLIHAYRVYGDERYLQAAVRCGEVVWARGLLRKGYGLCHGAAGNAYVFLRLFALTGKRGYYHRAVKFAEWCLTSSERHCSVPDRPFSLFEGLAGTAYFYSDVLQLEDPGSVKFPALELPIII